MQIPSRQLKAAQSLIKLPFINYVALTGSYAEDRATEKSDIDLFIQTEPGRLYLARLITTLYVHLIGLRRTDHSIAGKLCLNWFGTDNLPQIRGRKFVALAKRTTQSATRSKLLDLIEKTVKWFQVGRFKKDPRTHLPGSQVRWSDNELGFHPPKRV